MRSPPPSERHDGRELATAMCTGAERESLAGTAQPRARQVARASLCFLGCAATRDMAVEPASDRDRRSHQPGSSGQMKTVASKPPHSSQTDSMRQKRPLKSLASSQPQCAAPEHAGNRTKGLSSPGHSICYLRFLSRTSLVGTIRKQNVFGSARSGRSRRRHCSSLPRWGLPTP